MFAPCGIELIHVNESYPEIRADSCEEVVLGMLTQLSKIKSLKRPFMIEDSGLFIGALNGFPGVYSKWAFQKLGLDGILKLMKGIKKRDAHFTCVLGYYDGKKPRVFTGKVEGSIAAKKSGKSGFAYDPVFIPKDYKFSFADNMTLKSTLSHRKRATELMLKSIL